ncbi:FtsX-like permease family protein [Rubripirellula lacrimiformis]|uniref:FtsX-like permease family protein n=1 Tax=Rubripirellula lacrimiformis TaxID=1930273 RepID=A0A517N3R2_9BACT|nr:ABC transporter permease [Rubripirellula lacrimiformis]QDT01781.1 FtsX-like permease family protein [Rubripirellula lacrimiformis]
MKTNGNETGDRGTTADAVSGGRLGGLSIGRMIMAETRFSWRISISVALGVATATAVIVGALLVGDSMRGSLRGLTIERLGRTEAMIAPGTFFQADGIVADGVGSVPMIFFPTGTIETVRGSDGQLRRAGNVQIIAIDAGFWDLDATGVRPQQMPDDDGVVLNASAAAELGVVIGDNITLRLPSQQAVPADSPLGRRDIRSEGIPRLRVLDIIPDRGLGQFSVSPSQAAPQNVYVARSLVGQTLDRQGQANLLLLDSVVSDDDLKLDLDDLGLSLRRITRRFDGSEQDGPETSNPNDVILDYLSLTSDQLLLPADVVERVAAALPEGQVNPVMTYLANAIERVDDSGEVLASVPYSTITAIDRMMDADVAPSDVGSGATDRIPLDYSIPGGDAKPGQSDSDVVPLVINNWTADRLTASVGTRLRVSYFEPEVQDGKEIERSFDAVVTQIVPITEPDRPYRRRREAVFNDRPTIFNDPDLTPTVPGVTDQDSISDWDLPFRLDREITGEDDEYWNNHRLTPKAFMPLEQGRRLFGSRFGDTTGLQIAVTRGAVADDSVTTEVESTILRSLQPVLDDLGWHVRPIRSQQLAASKGTTPFDGLFLALSFFVILSAVMLIAMLFRLGLVSRMKQFGTLMAVGWTPRRVSRWMLGEGLLLATGGVLLGVVGGVAYAIIVLWALRSWWVGAVTVPFLTFHWSIFSLVVGAMIGWMVAAVTLLVTSRWILKLDAQTLLSGRDQDDGVSRRSTRSRLPIMAGVMVVAAIGVAVMGARSGGQAASGGFIGGGMLLLMASLITIYDRLRKPRQLGDPSQGADYTFTQMIARSASRHPLRSTMTIGLMATAAFLIIAIAAFRLQPTDKGTGGFSLVTQSAQPLYRDLSDPKVQSELLGPDAKSIADVPLVGMRMRLGQDASCNNLYQATQPTVLGVPDQMNELFSDAGPSTMVADSLAGFDWIGTDLPADSVDSPWSLLQSAATGSETDPIPLIIDQNTAMWSLQMTGGVGEVRSFEYQTGNPIFFRVVGLLSNSMLQGRLMIGEANFKTAFPDISGYRFFLIDARADRASDVASMLENRLGDIGMDVSRSDDVLAGMLAVQNTYLRTFQSLGALGLLLGTIGLAVAQLRSVLERRMELAVMRAIGFTQQRLATLVMGETAFLLLVGIGCGALCALISVLPYSWISGLRPPIVEPLIVVLGIIAFGMLAGLIAVRRVSRMPLLESLRSE